MKIWTKYPLQRVQLVGRIQKLVDDSSKKKLKAAEHNLIVNKEMDTMVRPSQFQSLSPKLFIDYALVFCEAMVFFNKFDVFSGEIQR